MPFNMVEEQDMLVAWQSVFAPAGSITPAGTIFVNQSDGPIRETKTDNDILLAEVTYQKKQTTCFKISCF